MHKTEGYAEIILLFSKNITSAFKILQLRQKILYHR